MRISHYLLILGVILGVIGFASAVLLDKRQLGMEIFLIGFFIGAMSSVYIALSKASSDFGKLGVPIKVAAGGFGLIVLGQMLGSLLGKDGLIANISLYSGLVVMLVGIVAAVLRFILNDS